MRAWRKMSISHRKQVAPFAARVESDADFTTSVVPIGKGEFLAARSIN